MLERMHMQVPIAIINRKLEDFDDNSPVRINPNAPGRAFLQDPLDDSLK
jgi:hypothetical protein